MTFNSIQGEAPLISEAIESEIIEMAEQRQEEGTQWFNRVMGIIGRGRKADDASFPVFRKRWKASQRHRPTLSTVLMCWKPAISRTTRKLRH